MRSTVVPSGPCRANSSTAASRILRFVRSGSRAIPPPPPTPALLSVVQATTVEPTQTLELDRSSPHVTICSGAAGDPGTAHGRPPRRRPHGRPAGRRGGVRADAAVRGDPAAGTRRRRPRRGRHLRPGDLFQPLLRDRLPDLG